MARTPFNLELQIREGWQNTDDTPKQEPIFAVLGCVISHKCYYRYNVNHPEVKRLFRAYCKKYGITSFPCSDKERFRFERDMDRHFFPNELPKEERENREIIETVVSSIDNYLKWRDKKIGEEVKA